LLPFTLQRKRLGVRFITCDLLTAAFRDRALLRLFNRNAATENAHHFTRSLRRLWLAPFADLSVTKTIEIVNGAGDAFGRTDDQDFEGNSVGF